MMNENWWKPRANEMSEATFDDAMFWKERDFYISKIVAEAERRGYERAMEEVKSIIGEEYDRNDCHVLCQECGDSHDKELRRRVMRRIDPIAKSFFEKV